MGKSIFKRSIFLKKIVISENTRPHQRTSVYSLWGRMSFLAVLSHGRATFLSAESILRVTITFTFTCLFVHLRRCCKMGRRSGLLSHRRPVNSQLDAFSGYINMSFSIFFAVEHHHRVNFVLNYSGLFVHSPRCCKMGRRSDLLSHRRPVNSSPR